MRSLTTMFRENALEKAKEVLAILDSHSSGQSAKYRQLVEDHAHHFARSLVEACERLEKLERIADLSRSLLSDIEDVASCYNVGVMLKEALDELG